MKVKNIQNVTSGLELIFQKIYYVPSVLKRLNDVGVRYGLYAGAVVKLISGNENLSDLDFLVYDDDSLKLKALFPFAKTKDVGEGCFLYIGSEEENLEFMFNGDIYRDGHVYKHRLTDLSVESIWKVEIANTYLPFTNIVETILFKVNLQREKDFKHLEILSQFVELESSDIEYAQTRIIEIDCDERTKRGLVSFPKLAEIF